jgi:hypothetical protein
VPTGYLIEQWHQALRIAPLPTRRPWPPSDVAVSDGKIFGQFDVPAEVPRVGRLPQIEP